MKRLTLLTILSSTILSLIALATPTTYSISTPELTLAQDITSDGHGAVQLRIVFEPATADISSQKWESSNSSVATVSTDGTLELLKPGQTDITVSFDGTKSDPCKLTVLLPENRSMEKRNLRFVPPVERGVNRIDKFELLSWPEKYGDTLIALWAEDRIGAYSMTYDDPPVFLELWRWNEILGKWGGAITLGLIAGLRDPETLANMKDGKGVTWADFIKAGSDVQSHSLTHRSGSERTSWKTADFHYEHQKSRDIIQKMLVDLRLDHLSRSQTFIGAYGGWPPNIIGRFYTAGRNGSHADPELAKASPIDYMSIGQSSAAGFATADAYIRPLIDRTIEDGTAPDAAKYQKNLGGLRNVLVHMITGTPNADGLTFSDDIEWIYDNYLHPNRHLVWYDNFTNMTCYAQQRDASEIKDKKVTSDRIEFTLTDYLDDELFQYPLTIKVRLDPTWNKLTVTQNGKPVTYKGGAPAESRLVKRDGQIYALVKAIPDRGPVVLAKQGPEKKFSPNAHLATLEYRANIEKKHNNPRLPVPAFDPVKTEYTVTLPPGTPNALIYGMPADPAATATRAPLMGTVALGSEPVTTTLTVVAEDGTTVTYTVTFAVAPFDPVQSLKLTAANNRDGEPNLKQVTISEPVYFTVKAEKEDLDAEGNLLARYYDPDTIEWLVNGEPQPDARGLTFAYMPATYGNYEIHARAGKIESNKIAISFTKGAPVPTRILWQDDFEKYTVGQPIPLSPDSAAPAAWTDRAAGLLTGIPQNDANWKNLDIAEMEGRGKVGRWTSQNIRTTGVLSKLLPIDGTPLVISAKIRVEVPEGSKAPLPSYSTFMSSQFGGRMATGLNWADNGAMVTPAGFGRGWPSGKWVQFAGIIDTKRNTPKGVRAAYYIGREDDNTFTAYEGSIGFIGDWGTAAVGSEVQRAVLFAFHGGPANHADLGKYSSYIDDVRIYHPGSFTMVPAQIAFTPADPVRMNFSHHVDIATLTLETVKVTDSKGTPVPLESLTIDPLNFDHVVLNFASGALKKGETYKVEFTETVRDIMDRTLYEAAIFKVQ